MKYFAIQRFNDGGICATVQTDMARLSRHYYIVSQSSAKRLADMVTKIGGRTYVTIKDDYIRVATFTD